MHSVNCKYLHPGGNCSHPTLWLNAGGAKTCQNIVKRADACTYREANPRPVVSMFQRADYEPRGQIIATDKPTRKVIQLTDRGVALCDDGTMWDLMSDKTWRQLPPIPQEQNRNE